MSDNSCYHLVTLAKFWFFEKWQDLVRDQPGRPLPKRSHSVYLENHVRRFKGYPDDGTLNEALMHIDQLLARTVGHAERIAYIVVPENIWEKWCDDTNIFAEIDLSDEKIDPEYLSRIHAKASFPKIVRRYRDAIPEIVIVAE